MALLTTHWAPSSDLGSRLPPLRFDNYGKYQRVFCDRFTGTVCLRATPRGPKAYIKIQRDGVTWRRMVIYMPPLEEDGLDYRWDWYREHVVSTCGALIWSHLRADRAIPLTRDNPAYWEAYLACRADGSLVSPEVASQFRQDLWGQPAFQSQDP
jgi:hypothetical protein